MLTLYFLKKFYVTFSAFFLGLLCILAFGDVLVRFAALPSFISIPKVIMLMVPIISVLAIPLASSLAVQTALGRLYENNEVLMLHYLPSARKKLFKAIGLFSLSLALPFSFIVFELGPKSHLKGKQFIVTLARGRLNQLEPGIFHDLHSRGTLYFEGKQGSKYEKVFLAYRDKGGENYVVIGQEGFLGEENFHLKDGVMETKSGDKHYLASFQETEINIDQLFNMNKKENNKLTSNVKYLGWDQLSRAKDQKGPAYIEYHARISQVLWQIILPFLALWGLILWGKMGRNNLLFTIFCASGLFLLSYIIIGVARSFSSSTTLMLFIFYVVPVLFCFLGYILCKKRL